MKIYKTASYGKLADVGDIYTPVMEEELEQKELEERRKRVRQRGDYASPHIKRPGKGRGIPRKLQRKGLETIVTDDDWNKLVDQAKNKELQLASSNKKIKK